MSELANMDSFAPRIWPLAHGKQIELGPRSVIMGILNVTPDSFSDGGQFDSVSRAVDRALSMVAAGAAIIDIGGESTRPGFEAAGAEVEQSRILPVIEALADREGILLSVDTYRAETARIAVDAGCHIINDVWAAQREPEIADAAAETGAGLCLMHTGRERERNPDVIRDQFEFLGRSLEISDAAGVERDRVILDPGFGFAKDPHENIALLARLEELLAFGLPLMTGTSRKRFIGHYTQRQVEDRAAGTAATSVIARMKGSTVFRVHDVAINKDVLAMADAVIASRRGMENHE